MRTRSSRPFARARWTSHRRFRRHRFLGSRRIWATRCMSRRNWRSITWVSISTPAVRQVAGIAPGAQPGNRPRAARAVGHRRGEVPAYTFVPPQIHGERSTRAGICGVADAATHRAGEAAAVGRRTCAAHRTALQQRGVAHPHRRGRGANVEEVLALETRLRAEEFKVLLQDIDRGDVTVFRASWWATSTMPTDFCKSCRADSGSTCRTMPIANTTICWNARRTRLIGRRRELMQRAEALMLADQPLIPLYFYVSKHLGAASCPRLAEQRDERGVQQESR